LRGIFQLFETGCCQFFRIECALFYHQGTLIVAFRANSRNIIGGNPSMVIPLLANGDLTPTLAQCSIERMNRSSWL